MNRITINLASQTLDNKDRESQGHYFIPIRAKVRGTVQFYERMGIDYIKRDVFRTFNISTRQGYEFLRNNSSLRQLHNDPNQKETYRCFCVISTEKLRKIERILQKEGIEARAITWE